MPYISLDNLTQYNGRLRDYIDSSFDKLDGANWRKTSATQSVSCWPIPESPLEPEVTFKFSEVPPESGDKGPDNPSTIVGVESVSCNVCESEGVDDTPYSIDLGGTYYGGTVNFATGVLEVTHYGMVVTGNEAWTNFYTPGTGRVQLSFANSPYKPTANQNEICSCTHYPYIGNNADTSPHWTPYADGQVCLYDSFGSLQAFKDFMAAQYAAGTPIVMTWKIAPYTVPLTPVLVRSLPATSHYTPRQNTIYTPHESVQVGYAKSASKTSQDLANAIVALGGNV